MRKELVVGYINLFGFKGVSEIRNVVSQDNVWSVKMSDSETFFPQTGNEL